MGDFIKRNIVIAGGGHAGIEAALAISRMGGKTTIVTLDANSIGRMSCNPAIGGLAKSHLVKEIDALGGIMGRAADYACLQFKTLNKSKGRSVWSPRAQVDKDKYSIFVREIIKADKNIDIIEGEVVGFGVDNSKLQGALLKDGGSIKCKALIITAGTFLNGLIHIGGLNFGAGRMGEKPSLGLSQALVNYGFNIGRLKTGTPPRAHRDSIDWGLTEIAGGDLNVSPFSILTDTPFNPDNFPCHIVNTNSNVHEIIKSNIHHSPMYTGKIKGVGPRYCPSIEDKIIRFQGRPSHQLFLEPEWKDSDQIYINGFSTSLPEDIQLKALRKIPALSNLEFIRPGYAIEYDYFPSSQLKSTLETKKIQNIFLAGQINGTSGYEEAAAQGLIAGINSHLSVNKSPPFILARNEAYIGVLIDDLIVKDINEPYRMFTSRAEHRLFLRPDTAGIRLTPKASKLNLISDKQRYLHDEFLKSYNKVTEYIKINKIYSKIKNKHDSIYNCILRSEFLLTGGNLDDEILASINPAVLFTVETDIKYKGYVDIENRRVEQFKKSEFIKISNKIDYSKLSSLSAESVIKLSRIRPETLGQASRIDGVRASDISILCIALKQLS